MQPTLEKLKFRAGYIYVHTDWDRVAHLAKTLDTHTKCNLEYAGLVRRADIVSGRYNLCNYCFI